jgi:hypothetical protein
MTRALCVSALALALLVGPGPPPLYADQVTAAVDRTVTWTFGPVVPQPHPKKKSFAYLATENHQIAVSYLYYQLENIGFGPPLKSGGKMTVTLKILKRNETIKIGKTKVKLEDFNEGYLKVGGVDWSDPSGAQDKTVRTEFFPINLEPGDVVLWTVKFKKMPRLEGPDHLPYVETLVCNCGSRDFPCSE